MKRTIALFARALAFALLLPVAVSAQQASYVMPSTGPVSLGTFVTAHLNPGLAALGQCSLGTAAPTNGPGGAAISGQCWWDTSATPRVLKVYDGTNWVAILQLNASTHAITFTQTTTLGLTGVTFANLPTPAAGYVAYVTDSNTSTAGATVAGSGSNKVLVWYNGTHWTVVGN